MPPLPLVLGTELVVALLLISQVYSRNITHIGKNDNDTTGPLLIFLFMVKDEVYEHLWLISMLQLCCL